MGELRDLEQERRKSKVNPGYRARTSWDPVPLSAHKHRCPYCKKIVGQSNGTIFQGKCPSCGRYVQLEKY